MTTPVTKVSTTQGENARRMTIKESLFSAAGSRPSPARRRITTKATFLSRYYKVFKISLLFIHGRQKSNNFHNDLKTFWISLFLMRRLRKLMLFSGRTSLRMKLTAKKELIFLFQMAPSRILCDQ